MVSKGQKQEVLASIKDKDLKMRISNIIDKANKSEAVYTIEATNFLNLNEKIVAEKILNYLKIKYEVIFANDFSEKSIIFFIPDYMSKDQVELKNYISCIKIEPKDISKLKHKDFMGSIYNLGIKEERIGDIFLNNKCGYVYVIHSIKKYILDNLLYVSNQEVVCEEISLDSLEAKNLKIEYEEKNCIIPSMRIDALISEIYNLGRKESKEKIVAGDLCINARVCISPTQEFQNGDIISLKKYGKLKIGEQIRTTKNGNICICIYKYK